MASQRAALVTYCSAGKDGKEDSGTQKKFISDFLGKKARRLLDEGRRRAFRGKYKRKGTWIDRKSPRLRAIDLYTGYFWRTPGLKQALRRLLASGVDCLVLSGGPGLLHVLEPFHHYNASIKDTRKLWRHRWGRILGDYIQHRGLQYLYIACSADYRDVLRSSRAIWMKNLKVVYWRVPRRPKGKGHARTEVPREAAEAVIALSRTGKPDARWTKERPISKSLLRRSKMTAKELYTQ